MSYDFDSVVDRKNTSSYKWDVKNGELPMWVADMDFKTAPAVINAIKKRTENGVFGYSVIPDEWYDAYINWWKTRHDFTIEKDWLIFSAGVIPTISTAVRKLSSPAEKVLIQTPVYNIFFNSIINNGRQVLESPLEYDGHEYHVDFDALEEKLSDPQTSLMILCNPHNPAGKIWDRETLARIGSLCHKYGVTVISDEVHCDLTDPGTEYIPFASVSEECRDISVSCIAPTKAFNIAGIQTSAVAVPNKFLRHKMWRALNTDEVAEPNVFACQAAVAAYTEGADYLDSLRSYIKANKDFVRSFIAEKIPQISVVPSQATYLLWIDCSRIIRKDTDLADFIRKNTGLYLSEGSQYGGNGSLFLRMNAACPLSVVEEGLRRLKKGIELYTGM